MIIIGDVHGDLDRYYGLISQLNSDHSLQLGDLGIGFRVGDDFIEDKFHDDLSHCFFPGNHDNRQKCNERVNCLGDWGHIPEIGLFWVSGGHSIDKNMRTEGVDWWRDEELNYAELIDVIEYFKVSKPKIVITHEAPVEVKYDILKGYTIYPYNSRTELALQQMFEEHQPDLWICGHYHLRKDLEYSSTKFVCLGALDQEQDLSNAYYEIPSLKWTPEI